MTTYYRLDDQGEIDWKSTEPRDYLPLRTEEEIVTGHDGKLYFASQCPEPPAPSMEARRAARILEIRAALKALDDLYMPPRVLAGLALGDSYAEEQWARHETEAEPLRAELRALEEEEAVADEPVSLELDGPETGPAESEEPAD